MTAGESTHSAAAAKRHPAASQARVLVVGVGGLGCPAALSLVHAGVGELVLLDDDEVDESNLHRQVLYSDRHLGRNKVDCAAEVLRESAQSMGSPTIIRAVRDRFLPHNGRQLARSVDLVVEGADNFATKFLAADACLLETKPVVHGAALRWDATVWAVGPAGGPCYRCLFEDIPIVEADNCTGAGVVGPVVGLAGALMAEAALRCLDAVPGPFGQLLRYDGRRDQLRAMDVAPRQQCPLCGPTRWIDELVLEHYLAGLGARRHPAPSPRVSTPLGGP